MGRLLKLVLIGGAIAGLAVVAKKLMGGLGPQPGSPAAPKEWPSLVPDPPARDTAAGNGSTPIVAEDADAAAVSDAVDPATEASPAGDPVVTEPAGAGFATTEPAPTEPATSEPAAAEPATTEAGAEAEQPSTPE